MFVKSPFVRNLILLILVVIAVLGFLQNLKIQQLAGMGDMRGRVAGARLILDGKLPYYYNWYPGDPVRYYYGGEVDSPRVAPTVVSGLTAPPAFLRAIGPIANAEQYKIDWGAFYLFHILWLCGLVFTLSKVSRDKWYIVLLLMVPFLWSDGWMNQVLISQYYALFGFMLLAIGLLLLRNKQIAAGLLFAVLILFRLNTLVFVLPFLIAAWYYRKFLFSSATGLLVYAVFVAVTPFEKQLWQQYFSSLKDHQELHMGKMPPAPMARIVTLPTLPTIVEGQDYHAMDKAYKESDIRIFMEASNFKQGYKAVMGRQPPAMMLSICLLGTILFVWVWMYRKRKMRTDAFDFPEYKHVLAGMLFYFLSSFFSTISNASYQFPQWLAVAVILGLYQTKIATKAILLFVFGVLVNCYWFPDFRGKHLISEVCLLAATLWVIIMPSRAESHSSSAVASSSVQH